MNTLTINSKAALTLARASEKARNEKPVVQKTADYGVYTVLTHNRTKKYTVRCNSATKEITCNCKATHPCYHIAAVAPIHSYIARQLRDQAAQDLAAAEAEANNWPLPGQSLHVVPSFFATDDEAERVATAATTAEDPAILYADLIPSFINEAPVDPTLCKCGEPGFTLIGGRWHCYPCIEVLAEAEAEKDAVRDLFEDKDHEDIFGFVPVRRERVKEAW